MSLDFLYYAVSWVLLRWHDLLGHLLAYDSGANWTLSIVFLVVTARLLLFRFFVKQVHYQRRVQELQPKIAALRTKHKNDRSEMQRQVMTLQQEQGFNPLSGCLPLLLQIPVFLGLFHVLRHLSNTAARCAAGAHYGGGLLHLYAFDARQTCSAAGAKLFGAPLAGHLTSTAHQVHLLGGHLDAMRIVVLVLVILSATATLLTQLLARRSGTTVAEGTAATVQKLMLVGIPLSTLASGLVFPLGVLLYWLTSNTWTLLQQLYVNRFHRASG